MRENFYRMEKVILSSSQIEQIADRTAEIVLNRLRPEPKPEPIYVNVKEAARIVGVSVSHMYKIRGEYPHIRRGEKQNGHIYFIREALAVKKPKAQDNK